MAVAPGPELAPVVHCALAQGRALFNQGDFWGSHEAWELAWRAAPSPERERIQGLIQAAAAFHKLVVQDNPAGARRLLGTALLRLRPAPPEALGLALAAFRAELEAWLARLPALTVADGVVLGLPRLAWASGAPGLRLEIDAVRLVAIQHHGRPALLVGLGAGGRMGWGECRAGWDAHGLWPALREGLAPALLAAPLRAPSELPPRLAGLASHPAAAAGLEAAAWDLYAQALGLPLAAALGPAPRPVPLAARVTGVRTADLARGLDRAAAAGYRLAWLDARPNADRRRLPSLFAGRPLPIALDLGEAYRMADVQALLALDALGAEAFLRPFPTERQADAARLARILHTPLAPGPWSSLGALDSALSQGAADAVLLDPGLCGLTAARQMAERAASGRRPCWLASSAVTAVGALADLAFAATAELGAPALLDGGRLADGSLAVRPEADGRAALPRRPGLGFAPDPDWLAAVADRDQVLHA